jgi:hypothetical protein
MNGSRNLTHLHPNDVYSVYVSYWQPDPGATNPEMPGRKAIMTMLIPAKSGMTCVCASGKTFESCCSQRSYWIPVCVNPDHEGYNKVEIHSAVYSSIDVFLSRSALAQDRRFRCVDDSDANPHWLFHNDSPKRFTEYGEINLGDIELKPDGRLLVTAMSRARMSALREILEGPALGLPRPVLTVEAIRRVPKPLSLGDMLPGIKKASMKAHKIRVPGRN